MKETVWDLTALYSDIELWEKDFAALQEKAEKFAAFKGRLAESPAVLKSAIEASDEFDRLAEKVYSYAHLKSDESGIGEAPRDAKQFTQVIFSIITP